MEAVEGCEMETEPVHQSPRKEVQRTGSVLSRKESSKRKHLHQKVERLTIDNLFEPDENDVSDLLLPRKHVLESLDFDQTSMTSVVTSELKDLGVEFENGRQSRSKSRKAPVVHSITPDQFLETVEVTLHKTVIRLCVPHVITQTCEFIRKDIGAEGIFRKSGSSSRVQNLKQRFVEREADVFNSDDTVIDAAVVLKMYLRELPAPLIPYDIHSVLLKCFSHPDELSRVEAILMSVYLLPLPNIHILIYLMTFLHDVVKHSHQNRMGYKNLALILTPNIMPVDEKGMQKGKESIIALEKNRKVIEVMILYGDYIGWVPSKLQKAIEVQLIYRNSDDELETDRHLGRDSRRKKRRSGSLTRMFGFLRKVTNSKGGETPSSTVETPDFGLHTPVLKGSTKKRANDEPMFSTQKKKTILDAVRRNGLHGADPHSPMGFLACPSPAICYDPSPMKVEWKQPMSSLATPNIVRDKLRSKSTPDNTRIPLSGAAKSSSKHNRLGFGRKSGKKVEWSDSDSLDLESPQASSKNLLLQLPKYFKNFKLLPSKSLKASVSASPCPLSVACADETFSNVKLAKFAPNPSAHSYPLMPKEDALLHQQAQKNLQRSDLAVSVVSIHNLQNSPRKKVNRRLTEDDDEISITSSTGTLAVPVPPPPQFSDPSPSYAQSQESISTDSGDGTYVTIAPTAVVNDIPNEAFIASSGSLDLTDGGSCENLSNSSHEDVENRKKSLPIECLRLTPLIKEINTLTLFAQQDPISPAFRSVEQLGPPHGNPFEISSTVMFDNNSANTAIFEASNTMNGANASETSLHEKTRTPSKLEEVAAEFKRTLQEEKLIKLCQEMKGVSPSVQRRSSIVERGVSPSRRKINSFRRRRSHDSAKGTPPVAQSPRFMSLRSPRSRPVPPPISRSPTRCTLRRGRPNTAWAGLPRPSPARATSQGSTRSPRVRVVYSSSNIRDRVALKDSGNVISPVMRRMSSVQELVHRLERRAKMQKGLSIDDSIDEATRERLSLPSNSGPWHVQDQSVPPFEQATIAPGVLGPSESQSQMKPPTPNQMKPPTPNQMKPHTPNLGNDWVNGESFRFDDGGDQTPPVVQTPVVGNRESIHFLKTRNAGKVSANVRMFDGMIKKTKSPTAGKSMIPRYTALHARPQTKP